MTFKRPLPPQAVRLSRDPWQFVRGLFEGSDRAAGDWLWQTFGTLHVLTSTSSFSILTKRISYGLKCLRNTSQSCRDSSRRAVAVFLQNASRIAPVWVPVGQVAKRVKVPSTVTPRG
jgi:hypothetical protein